MISIFCRYCNKDSLLIFFSSFQHEIEAMIKAIEGERKRVAGEWESISQVRPFMRMGLFYLRAVLI